MAKRKKLKDVKINEQELTPTVLGYLNEKKANPLFLIVVFGILLTFLYFLPEVNQYIEHKRGNDYSGNVPYVPSDNEEKFEQNDAGKEFDFNNDLVIVINELELSSFTIKEDIISFNIKNNSSKHIDFGQFNYYIYLKGLDGNIVDIIKLDDLVILEESEKEISYYIENDEISKILVDEFNETYLVDVNLVDNMLTCILEDETYKYVFENDSLVNELYILENISASDSLIYKYKKRKEKYQIYDGVDIKIDDRNGLYYEINVNVNIADTLKLNDDFIFDKNYKAKVIKFRLEENGYTCS